MLISAKWINWNMESAEREERIGLTQLDGRLTDEEMRHWVRRNELKRQLTYDNFNKWLYLSATGWFTTEELEEWIVIHPKLTDDEMVQWFRDVKERKLQTEEEREMARECITIQQLAQGRQRLKLEKKLNREELGVWLPYRRRLGAQHLKEWLELRPRLVDEEKFKWCVQRKVSEQSVAWKIAEQGVLAERFSLWLSETLSTRLPTMDYRSLVWLSLRPG